MNGTEYLRNGGTVSNEAFLAAEQLHRYNEDGSYAGRIETPSALAELRAIVEAAR